MIVPGYKYAIEPNVILFVCTIECCFEKVKLDYRQKCKISMIFQIVVIQRAKQGFCARHLLWLRCSAEVNLAGGHLMHLETG